MNRKLRLHLTFKDLIYWIFNINKHRTKCGSLYRACRINYIWKKLISKTGNETKSNYYAIGVLERLIKKSGDKGKQL